MKLCSEFFQVIEFLQKAETISPVHTYQFQPESAVYSGYSFQSKSCIGYFRIGKKTPLKSGYFIAFWKRDEQGITIPYAVEDTFNVLVVAVCNENQLGFFTFPKNVLHKYGCLSFQKKGGKRGMRLYAPWNDVTSVEAQRAKKWQIQYFRILKTKL